jgi:hypothetical protein
MVEEFNSEYGENRHKYISKDGKLIYSLAIIDYLQEWNGEKKREQCAKVMLLGKNKKKLSAVEPIFFSERWITFMNDKVIID